MPGHITGQMTGQMTGMSPSRIARLVAPRRFELMSQTTGDPPPGSVRVRVLACGVCASELHAVEGTLES